MGNIRAGDDIFFTVTMAEVLEKQGHLEDALMIYKILADSAPWDQTLAYRIEKLKSLAEKKRKAPQKGDQHPRD